MFPVGPRTPCHSRPSSGAFPLGIFLSRASKRASVLRCRDLCVLIDLNQYPMPLQITTCQGEGVPDEAVDVEQPFARHPS